MNLLKALLFSLACSLPAFAANNSININTADAPTIAKGLTGIGPKKAEAIVAYRTQHGPFKSIDDLTHVKGITAKLITKNHDVLALEGSTKVDTKTNDKSSAKAAGN